MAKEAVSERASDCSEELLESCLGTKQFWDDRYKLELKNFENNGDEGEIWFGISTENRVIKYLNKSNISRESRIIDLGCGNASLLRHLRNNHFVNLTGVDYCSDAIELSKSIMEHERKQSGINLPDIHLEVVDILAEDGLQGTYDVALDKGTWDAMSLSVDRDSRLAAYRKFLSRVIAPGGIFVIFSCNFTRDELRSQFEGSGLSFEEEIRSTHSIVFGGKEGLTSTGIVFRNQS